MTSEIEILEPVHKVCDAFFPTEEAAWEFYQSTHAKRFFPLIEFTTVDQEQG